LRRSWIRRKRLLTLVVREAPNSTTQSDSSRRRCPRNRRSEPRRMRGCPEEAISVLITAGRKILPNRASPRAPRHIRPLGLNPRIEVAVLRSCQRKPAARQPAPSSIPVRRYDETGPHRGGIPARLNVNEFQTRPANCPRLRDQASRYSSCRLIHERGNRSRRPY
jgi:hypothetical protein